MNEFILLIHGNEKTATTAEEWDRFFHAAHKSGAFCGGSEIGPREQIGDRESARSSEHIMGYMRFASGDKTMLLELLKEHPVVLHGGSVELCELSKS